MQQEKIVLGPVLSLKFSRNKGIQFAWNFKGILHSEPEISHIFILQKIDSEEANRFLKTYYSTIKNGDLIGILKTSKDNKNQSKIKITQKMGSEFPIDFVKKKYIQTEGIAITIENAFKKLQKRSNIIFLNIMMNPFNQFCSFEEFLQLTERKLFSLRVNNSNTDKIIVNFIVPFLSEVSIDGVNGLNTFHYFKENPLQTCKQIRSYCKSLVMESVMLRMEFKDSGFRGVSTDTDWIARDINVLQKKYVGIPSVAFEEYILFMHPDQLNEIDINIVFDITFTLFNRCKVHDRKVFKVQGDISKVYQRTLTSDYRKYYSYCEIYRKTPVLTSFCKKEHYILLNQKQALTKTSQ